MGGTIASSYDESNSYAFDPKAPQTETAVQGADRPLIPASGGEQGCRSRERLSYLSLVIVVREKLVLVAFKR